jgi:hypothetical protein
MMAQQNSLAPTLILFRFEHAGKLLKKFEILVDLDARLHITAALSILVL